MKRLMMFAGVAVVSTLIAVTVHAKDRGPRIHFTQNHSNHGQYAGKCLGSVTYEILPAQPGDVVRWTIINGNGSGSADDVCEDQKTTMDKTKVRLRFKRSPFTGSFGTAVELGPPSMIGGKYVIEATVDSRAVPTDRYQYVVVYDGVPAGPDPEIEIDCPTCG